MKNLFILDVIKFLFRISVAIALGVVLLLIYKEAFAKEYVPYQSDTVFAVEFLDRGQSVQVVDRSTSARASTTEIVRIDGRCKWYRVNGTSPEWKACRDGTYWNFYGRSGGITKIQINGNGNSSVCVSFSSTMSGSNLRINAQACRDRTNKWTIRE